MYVFGGYAARPVAHAAAYDTQARTWSPVSPMPTARGSLAVAAGPGRVHVLGGEDAARHGLPTHEVYSPADDAWTTAAPMPTGRAILAAATGPDDVVYALGGIDYGHGNSPFAAVEAYVAATDTWESRAPMPTARWGLAAVAGPDGLIYAIGGVADHGHGDENDICATVEAYDPGSDTWSTRPSLPSTTVGLGAAIGPNGLIIAIGGADTATAATGATFSFDPAAPTKPWDTLASMPTPRYFVAAAAGADGLIHVVGGTAGKYPDTHLVDVVEAYAYSPPERVFDHVPVLIGRLVGGVARDGAGGILIGDHFVPIPPRSPLMEAILELAGDRLTGAVVDRDMGGLGQRLQRESAARRWSDLLPGRNAGRS